MKIDAGYLIVTSIAVNAVFFSRLDARDTNKLTPKQKWEKVHGQQWECQSSRFPTVDDNLDYWNVEYGKWGWELKTIIKEGGKHGKLFTAVFKRPKG